MGCKPMAYITMVFADHARPHLPSPAPDAPGQKASQTA